MEPEEPDFTDYLSHVVLSGHNYSFNKYDKKFFIQVTDFSFKWCIDMMASSSLRIYCMNVTYGWMM